VFLCESGRRALALGIAVRAIAVLTGLWLTALIVGGLGFASLPAMPRPVTGATRTLALAVAPPWRLPARPVHVGRAVVRPAIDVAQTAFVSTASVRAVKVRRVRAYASRGSLVMDRRVPPVHCPVERATATSISTIPSDSPTASRIPRGAARPASGQRRPRALQGGVRCDALSA
jgi:hypothetical protein